MNKLINSNQEFQSDFLSVTEARNAISTLIQDIQLQAKRFDAIEKLPLKQCLGRILANDIPVSYTHLTLPTIYSV